MTHWYLARILMKQAPLLLLRGLSRLTVRWVR